MKAPDRELRRLADAWHDGTIGPEDGAQLAYRLSNDPAAREYLFDIAEIETALPTAAAQLTRVSTVGVPRRFWTHWRQLAALFVAGLFCGGLGWQAFGLRSSHVAGARSSPAATITGMLGVAWEGQAADTPMAFAVGSPESSVSSGLVELTFTSGTRAVIEGPAAFRVLGDNAMSLSRGRMVADVPKGAEGFTVNYRDGTIVDLGTEFGVDVSADGSSADFGVFRGEIEFHPQGDDGRRVLLRENHAMSAKQGNLISVPFEQDKYTRRLPSREFAWKITDGPPRELVWQFDVSHLIWHPGRYRAICKWMTGTHGIAIRSAELLCDGERVGYDVHSGFTGHTVHTHDNTYDLTVPEASYRRGQWTMRLEVSVQGEPEDVSDSAGVVLLEEGFALKAGPSDFVGTWEYLHDGHVYRRTFAADGTASLTNDGIDQPGFHNSRWRVEGGFLHLDLHLEGNSWLQEMHFLRDQETLVFINQPYRDAKRTED